jgi:hypothetical protein
MSGQGEGDKAYQANAARHRELKALLARIEQSLAERTATIDEVSDLLGQLGDRLVKHFAMEEDGGYFADVLLHAPQLISKANALLAQHPKMCAQAKDLTVEIATRIPARGDWWQHTGELFRAFRDELSRHEKQEDGLLQEAYSQDIGAND